MLTDEDIMEIRNRAKLNDNRQIDPMAFAREIERAVLAKAGEQEPVAYGIPNSAITGKAQPMMTLHHERCGQYPELMVPLYAHPLPAQAIPDIKND